MSNRHILITGASRGIGAALARTYAAPNTHLSLIASKIGNLDNIKQLCLELGATVSCYGLDLREHETTHALISTINDKHPVDVVIANAGMTSSTSKQHPIEKWNTLSAIIDINLTGAIATVNPLIETMQKRKSGKIVFISSLAAFYGMALTPAYSASKAGLKAYGEALQGLLNPYKVQVSIVYPGFVESDMSQAFPGSKPFMITPEKAAKKIITKIDQGRSHISFPFPLNIGTKFLAICPNWFANWMVNRVCYPIK